MVQERRHDMGVGGFCICPKCGEQIEHQHGIPCQEEKCPECGAKMLLLIEESGDYYFRMYPREPVRIIRLAIIPLENKSW